MRRNLTLLITLILLTSCSTNENEGSIVKATDTIEEVLANPEAELTEIEEEFEKYIEFEVDEEQVLVDISKVPILYDFLRLQRNPARAIQKMNVEKLEIEQQNIYTLRFSCMKERCSYLLFHQDQNKSAFLVADMARLINVFISPNQSKIALQFNRASEETMPLSNLIVFDIYNWEPLSLNSDENTTNILNYSWPFVAVEWIDDEQIAISIPELIEPYKESYEEWTSTEGNSVDIVTFDLYNKD